jgi:hypothetical protein
MYFLKMLKHLELPGVPSMLYEFVAHELARGQKKVDAFAVSAQPSVDVSLRHEHQTRRRAGVASSLKISLNFPPLQASQAFPLETML